VAPTCRQQQSAPSGDDNIEIAPAGTPNGVIDADVTPESG
jgi:hypothetical protein